MSLSTRTTRLLTRIAISASVFVVFAMHVAASPRFEIIDRIENYLYDVRVRMTMPGIVDVLFDEYGIRALGFVFRDSVAARLYRHPEQRRALSSGAICRYSRDPCRAGRKTRRH